MTNDIEEEIQEFSNMTSWEIPAYSHLALPKKTNFSVDRPGQGAPQVVMSFVSVAMSKKLCQ